MALLFVRLVVLSLYGCVLAITGGVLIWATVALGLSEITGIMIATGFLGIESILWVFDRYPPGIAITSILVSPIVFLCIKPKRPSSSISEKRVVFKSAEQIIRKILVTRNMTA